MACKTADAALPPIVRYQMLPSTYDMEWADLHNVVRMQANLKFEVGDGHCDGRHASARQGWLDTTWRSHASNLCGTLRSEHIQ